MSHGWCKTFQLVAASYERRLHELKLRYGEELSEEMVAWAKTKAMSSLSGFDDWLDEAEKRVTSGGSELMWRPIETASQDEHLNVLLWCPGDGGVLIGSRSSTSETGWSDNGEGFEVNPTHWMPLVDPPEESYVGVKI